MTLDEKICRNTTPIPREVCLRAVNLNVLKDHHARQSCIRQAMAKPLPGAAGDAFLKGAITIGENGCEYIIHEVLVIHKKCLQAIDSPLLKMTPNGVDESGKQKISVPEFDCQDEWNICYIFTENPDVFFETPKTKLPELIASNAKSKFKTVNSSYINGICSAVMKQFERHVETNARFESQVEGSGEKKSSCSA